MHEIARRAKLARPAHPGQHDVRAVLGDGAAKAAAGRAVEDAAEWQLARGDAACAQRRPVLGMAQQHELVLAGTLQHQREAQEEPLRPAVARAADRLQQPHRPIPIPSRAAP